MRQTRMPAILRQMDQPQLTQALRCQLLRQKRKIRIDKARGSKNKSFSWHPVFIQARVMPRLWYTAPLNSCYNRTTERRSSYATPSFSKSCLCWTQMALSSATTAATWLDVISIAAGPILQNYSTQLFISPRSSSRSITRKTKLSSSAICMAIVGSAMSSCMGAFQVKARSTNIRTITWSRSCPTSWPRRTACSPLTTVSLRTRETKMRPHALLCSSNLGFWTRTRLSRRSMQLSTPRTSIFRARRKSLSRMTNKLKAVN